MAAAPIAVYRREDGLVIIDPAKAKGNRDLAAACPYGVIYYNDALDLPQKCTGCAHLIDANWERPRCVTACPNDALQYVDINELTEENLYAPLERLHPEYGTKPSVAYVRLPKIFVAGELASNDLGQCIEGAHVTVTHQVSGESFNAWSGTFGDFHIDVAKPGFYTIAFARDGFKRKTITDVDLRESRSLDVVKLWKRSE
jgi:hypothetical protein